MITLIHAQMEDRQMSRFLSRIFDHLDFGPGLYTKLEIAELALEGRTEIMWQQDNSFLLIFNVRDFRDMAGEVER